MRMCLIFALVSQSQYFVKHLHRGRDVAKVMYQDVWGKRHDKYTTLDRSDIETSEWLEVSVKPPYYSFVPMDLSAVDEYSSLASVKELMSTNSLGIFTARDSLTIHDSPETLWKTVSQFASMDTEVAREHYGLGTDGTGWSVQWAQSDITSNDGPNADNMVKIAYRPFDSRYTYYTGKTNGFMCRPRRQIMSHFLGKTSDPNLGYVVGRAGQAADFINWNVIYCTDSLLDQNIFRRGGGARYSHSTSIPANRKN